MAVMHRKCALALLGGVAAVITAAAPVTGASAQERLRRPVPAARSVALRPRAARLAAARPLTIRRRAAVAPVDVVGGPGFYDDYLVRQHSWNDTNLYYWGPFRTGGDVKYGDVAGNPITRGNPGLGQVAGYGPARGGYGGPHFDAVGGFHNEPGPDYQIDNDYASGSLSTPDYGAFVPHYPGVKAQVARLDEGVVPRRLGPAVSFRPEGPMTRVSFEEAKQQFAAPMRREAPVEAGFGNGGLGTIGMQISNGEF